MKTLSQAIEKKSKAKRNQGPVPKRRYCGGPYKHGGKTLTCGKVNPFTEVKLFQCPRCAEVDAQIHRPEVVLRLPDVIPITE